jgi:hypothetical protein
MTISQWFYGCANNSDSFRCCEDFFDLLIVYDGHTIFEPSKEQTA